MIWLRLWQVGAILTVAGSLTGLAGAWGKKFRREPVWSLLEDLGAAVLTGAILCWILFLQGKLLGLC